jgi:hypothetical protein
MRIAPLGMSAAELETLFSRAESSVYVEIAGSFWCNADVSIDVSKVDTQSVGVYYPVTLRFPHGIEFRLEEHLYTEMAVYVIDPEEVDFLTLHEFWGGVSASWLKEIAELELWVSVDGGDFLNAADGGDWFIGIGGNASDVFVTNPGPPFTSLSIYIQELTSGHVYDFEVRYENGGISVNRIRIDLTGDRPVIQLTDGDRTGGDRYPNPWDVITGGNDADGDGGGNGNGSNGNDNGNGDSTTPPNGSGNGNNQTSGDNPGGDTQIGPQSPGAKQDTTTSEPGGNEPGSAPQTPASGVNNDVNNNDPQQSPETKNLVLEPSNPIIAASTGTEPDSGALSNGNTVISGLSIGSNGYYFDLDGDDKPMELRFDFPFDDFDGLYMNGDLWLPGVDYSARAGSTIITVSAARLSRLGAGTHTLIAIFAGEPVEVVFTLNASAPVSQTSALIAPVVPQIPLPNILPESNMLAEQMEAAPSFPVLPFVISIIGIGSFGLWLVVFLRQRKVLAGR